MARSTKKQKKPHNHQISEDKIEATEIQHKRFLKKKTFSKKQQLNAIKPSTMGMFQRSINWLKESVNLKNRRSQKRFVFLGVVIGVFIAFFWNTPLPTTLSTREIDVSTKIFDRNDNLIFEIYADQRRSPIELEQIPEHVKQATIAIEDKDFYNHYGFSVTGIARAFYKIVTQRKLEGGSTLTQQLIKNALLTNERTIKRKVREFALAMIVETIYTKDQILEMYLNQIPYGSTAYGIESASELYFGKSSKDLSLEEATLLAGLPQAPTRYSPFGANPENAKQRQATVLRRMVEDGYISQEQADEAAKAELTFVEPGDLEAPHFALWVKELLAEEYGDAVVEQGGLRVKTTLDLELQRMAEDAVAEEVTDLSSLGVGNGAAIVTRPESGEILAMVGSKDYFAEDEDGKVNIILAKRQPGSSIKPLNYALAIEEKRLTASTPLADIPTCFIVAGQREYCPRNYDFTFHGAQQVRYSLANSYNVPAVRVLALNGLDNFVEFGNKMGLTTFTDPSQYGLSLTLGGGEVRPLDMATAYGVFANQGVKQPLTAILEVTDWKGNTLQKTNLDDVESERVLSPETSFIISDILNDNGARSAAFGSNSLLNVEDHPEVSVKTGTTNDLKDNWTAGYTRDIVVVTWVGNNDNTPMSGAVSGVSGASPIWNEIIKFALDKAEQGTYNKEDEGHGWPLEPDSVRGVNVCSQSGNLPSEGEACETRFEYFLESKIGAAIQYGIQAMFIDKETQAPAKEDVPEDRKEAQERPFLVDPLGTLICLNCPAASQSATIGYPLRGN